MEPGTWIALGSAVGAILLALLKGIFGMSEPKKTTIVEVSGEPIGPRLAARLRALADRP